MTIQYNVDKNSITEIPTYYPRVAPIETLDLNQICSLINIHNPNVPVGTAKNCIDLFVEEIKNQLIAGNWVKIDSFCSFSSSLVNGVLTAPSDPLPAGTVVKLNFKASTPFRNAVRQAASYERIGYINKTPSVVNVSDESISINNVFNTGRGVSISGEFIGFNQAASDEGVFLQMDGGSAVKQTNIARNKPSNIIAIMSATPTLGAVAGKLTVKTRYTTNGSLKEITYPTDIRHQNDILTTDTDSVVFKPYGAASVVVLNTTTAGKVLFSLRINTSGELYIYSQDIVNNIVQAASEQVLITAADDYVVDTNYTFTVSNYDTLFSYVESVGKFVQELVSVTTP